MTHKYSSIISRAGFWEVQFCVSASQLLKLGESPRINKAIRKSCKAMEPKTPRVPHDVRMGPWLWDYGMVVPQVTESRRAGDPHGGPLTPHSIGHSDSTNFCFPLGCLPHCPVAILRLYHACWEETMKKCKLEKKKKSKLFFLKLKRGRVVDIILFTLKLKAYIPSRFLSILTILYTKSFFCKSKCPCCLVISYSFWAYGL